MNCCIKTTSAEIGCRYPPIALPDPFAPVRSRRALSLRGPVKMLPAQSVRLHLSASAIALSAAFATPAFAQTETSQVDAQKVNQAVECSTIADPVKRQKCVETQGTN